MSAIWTLAIKDLRVLFRDRFGLFWMLAFPLMYAGFFGMIFGGPGEGERARLPLAIVDEDQSEASAKLLDRLAASDGFDVERETESGRIRSYSLEEARAAVRRGDKVAYVRIPEGLGEQPFSLFAGAAEGGPRIEVGIDPSRSAEKGMLQGLLMECLFSGIGEQFQDKEAMARQIRKGRDEIRQADDLTSTQKTLLLGFLGAVEAFVQQADEALLAGGPAGAMSGEDLVEFFDVSRERGKRPRSAFEITFPQAMVWGLIGVALGFAITIVRERTQGTLLRLRVAPIGRAQLLAGKALACFLGCLLTMGFLLAFGLLVLRVRVESPLLLALSMAATAACFTGIMMIASVMGKTEQAVAGASWGTMMPFAMIGGGMIPLIAMPSWLVRLSDISPFKWAILSMEGAVWRGFGIADMLGPCLVLVAIGAACFATGVLVYRKMEG